MQKSPLLVLLAGLALQTLSVSLYAQAAPIPAGPGQPVAGWKAPEPGEHPRLFFRKSDLPAIRTRASTPEGQLIVARLHFLLNGANGDTLPELYNTNPILSTADGATSNTNEAPHGKAFTLWHAAGYGTLYQLTGDKKFADLARQSAEKMLEGQRDRDNRYSYFDPHGALRAGPSLAAMAMAYDLCYDAWEPAFRQKIAQSIATYKPAKQWTSLPELARGARHTPAKNHWGGQVGGAAIALLAIMNDPGVDMGVIAPLLATNRKAMQRQLAEGYSEFGFQSEGQGPGSITSDTAYVPALQAWRVAGGVDFVTGQNRASWILMLKVHDLFLVEGTPWLFNRNMGYGTSYGTGNYSAGPNGDRDGLSRGGQWAQGFGAIEPKYRGAALWTYNHILEPDPAKRTFDLVGPYPHRPLLALVNWPIGEKEQNPAEVMPRVVRDSNGYVTARNAWTGPDDCGLSLLAGTPIMGWGLGIRHEWGAWPSRRSTHWEEKPDGSFALSGDNGGFIAVDFSKKSGADMLVATAGRANGGKDGDTKSRSGGVLRVTTHALGGQSVQIRTYSKGEPPERTVNADSITVGAQTISFDGDKFTLR